jgi:hypothetical protein
VRVLFDGACLGDLPVTGVGRAFLNGLDAYARAFARDGGDDLVLLLPDAATAPDVAGATIVRGPRGALRRQWLLPRLVRRLGIDVLHSSVAAVPLAASCPTIATVHDLPWHHAEAGERGSAWRRFATRRSLRAAAAVLAPSTFTARDAAHERGRDDVLVVPHGTPLPALNDPAARAGPLLALGDDRPRKNRELVLRGHALARARDARVPDLRFVGPPDAWVDEAEKHRLLATCFAVVQGSRFEGFGLPVLEALAHGAPLACSDIPPFREIAGDDAEYFDPADENSIAAALLRLGEPARWLALARRGPARAAAFSPARVAASWRTLHEQLHRGGARA